MLKNGPNIGLISAAKRWQTMLSRCWLIVGFMSHKKKNKMSWHSVTLLYLIFIGSILVTTGSRYWHDWQRYLLSIGPFIIFYVGTRLSTLAVFAQRQLNIFQCLITL